MTQAISIALLLGLSFIFVPILQWVRHPEQSPFKWLLLLLTLVRMRYEKPARARYGWLLLWFACSCLVICTAPYASWVFPNESVLLFSFALVFIMGLFHILLALTKKEELTLLISLDSFILRQFSILLLGLSVFVLGQNEFNFHIRFLGNTSILAEIESWPIWHNPTSFLACLLGLSVFYFSSFNMSIRPIPSEKSELRGKELALFSVVRHLEFWAICVVTSGIYLRNILLQMSLLDMLFLAVKSGILAVLCISLTKLCQFFLKQTAWVFGSAIFLIAVKLIEVLAS